MRVSMKKSQETVGVANRVNQGRLQSSRVESTEEML